MIIHDKILTINIFETEGLGGFGWFRSAGTDIFKSYNYTNIADTCYDSDAGNQYQHDATHIIQPKINNRI